MKATASELLSRLPTAQGERFIVAMSHGSMSVELYAPRGSDPQTPHAQDELYFIHAGQGVFVNDGERIAFVAGDCLFVAAGVAHRFENFTDDFAAWVVFWGPEGGES